MGWRGYRSRWSDPSTMGRAFSYSRLRETDLKGPPPGQAAVDAANLEVFEAKVAAEDHLAKKAIVEVLEAQPAMRARPDKRRRPKGVKKEVFKRSRKLKLK